MWSVDLKGFGTTFKVCNKFIKFVLLPTLMVLLSELLIYLGPLQSFSKVSSAMKYNNTRIN